MLRRATQQTKRTGRTIGKVELRCKVCLRPFMVHPYRQLAARVCSYACGGIYRRTRVPRTCLNCGNPFSVSPSQFRAYKGAGRYCSRDCSYQGTIKQTAHKPIKDKYGRSNRKADKDWKIAVREKDKNTCQKCGKVEKYIHTHHVAPRSQRPDLRHDVSNGKCLCNVCHSWVHNHPLEAKAIGLLSSETYELARKTAQGEEHGGARLTEEKVKAIRARYASGERSADLAVEFLVTPEHVWRVVARKVWTHI